MRYEIAAAVAYQFWIVHALNLVNFGLVVNRNVTPLQSTNHIATIETMWKTAKALLGSKKFLVTLAGVAGWAAARFGYDVPAAELQDAMLALAALVLAIGLQDHGKERAAIEAGAEEDDE
jgi:hypothetical protein